VRVGHSGQATREQGHSGDLALPKGALSRATCEIAQAHLISPQSFFRHRPPGRAVYHAHRGKPAWGYLAGEGIAVARLAISKGFLAEYVKLNKDLQRAVDQAIAAFARDSQPALQLETPEHGHDDRIGIMAVNGHWRGVVLTPGDTWPEDTYSLVTVLPQDQVDAYVTNYLFRTSQPLEVLTVRPGPAGPEDTIGQHEPSVQVAAEAEPPPVGLSDPATASPRLDAQLGPAVSPLAEEADAETVPATAEAAAPDVPVTGMTEKLAAMQRSLAHPFAAWRSRRRSRQAAREARALREARWVLPACSYVAVAAASLFLSGPTSGTPARS
jgi:hypothetical protein